MQICRMPLDGTGRAGHVETKSRFKISDMHSIAAHQLLNSTQISSQAQKDYKYLSVSTGEQTFFKGETM